LTDVRKSRTVTIETGESPMLESEKKCVLKLKTGRVFDKNDRAILIDGMVDVDAEKVMAIRMEYENGSEIIPWSLDERILNDFGRILSDQ